MKQEVNIKEELDKINQMSQQEMASLYRNAPVGHPYFSTDHTELLNAFKERFKALGGMTPSVSKSIGWK